MESLASVGRCAPLAERRQRVRRSSIKAQASLKRAFNFSAGPACLPLDVLQTAQSEMLDWHGSGMSVLEMSHRGPEFESIIAKTEADLRTLMKVPDNYKARRPQPLLSWPLTVARTFWPPGPVRAGWRVHAVCRAAPQLCARGCHRGLRCHRLLGRQVSCWHASPSLLLTLAPRAAEEAAKYNNVNIAATGKAGKFTGEWALLCIPDTCSLQAKISQRRARGS